MKYKCIVLLMIILVVLSGCSNVNMEESHLESQQPVMNKASFITIIRNLERNTLDVMAVAEHKVRGEDAPTFEQLKSELLKYNTENAIERWGDMYNNSPGWIMEPRGLVFASEHSMYESSFQFTEENDKKVIIAFKTYGDPQYRRAEQVKYTLVKSNKEDWRMDTLEVTPLENGFSLDEVKEIMSYEIESAEYVDEDYDYYYFEAVDQEEDNQYHVFHKKDGYREFWYWKEQ